jgi:hypothetical protein
MCSSAVQASEQAAASLERAAAALFSRLATLLTSAQQSRLPKRRGRVNSIFKGLTKKCQQLFAVRGFLVSSPNEFPTQRNQGDAFAGFVPSFGAWPMFQNALPVDPMERTIWIADAHRDGKRFVVRAACLVLKRTNDKKVMIKSIDRSSLRLGTF